MDTSAVTLEDGDFCNLSSYGIEFLRLTRQFGSGGMQIRGGIGALPFGGGGFGYGGY
jgi:hypothetical protein